MFLPKKCPNKTKDQDQNQTPEESTSDIQQWVRIKFNNSFVAKYRCSVGPTKKHRTSRKQRKTRNNSDSADTATVARPSKSTPHHESEPKQKQTNVGVMSEKPNCAGKFSNSNHLKEQQLHLRNILSSQTYKRARQQTRYEKLPFKTGFLI